jgi:hypothetical protein
LLEPPTKQEKASEGRRTNVICDQCNKSRHSKECCHWNLENSNNKLKDKKEVAMNGILAQTNGGIKNKSSNKGGHEKANKSNSIIYCCFISNFVEHKIYNCLHKDVAQVMFKKKVVAAIPKKENVAINMVLVVITCNHVLKNVVFKEK